MNIKKMRWIFRSFFVLCLFVLAFNSCELGQVIDAVVDNSTNTNTVLIALTQPTNNQIIATNYQFVGSAYSSAGLLNASFYIVKSNDMTTNNEIFIMNNEYMSVYRKPIEFTDEGYYYVWAQAVDSAGFKANSETITVKVQNGTVIDNTPPVLTITTPTNLQNVGQSYELAGSVSDTGGSGLKCVWVKMDNDMAFKKAEVVSDNWFTNWTLLNEGYHTNTVYAEDNAGNLSSEFNVIVNYVAGMPSVLITSPSQGTITKNSTIDISGTASVSGATITNVVIDVNGNIENATGTDSWSKSISLEEGSNSIQVTAYSDNGYNADSTTTIILDSEVPNCVITYPTIGEKITNQTSVTIQGSSSDTGTGVAENYVAIDSGSFQLASGVESWTQTQTFTAGTYTVKAYSVDNAGNISATNTVDFEVVTVDTQKPTISINTPSNGSSSTNDTVIVSGTAADNVAVQAIYIKLDSGSFVNASGTSTWSKSLSVSIGSHTAYVYAVDTSGNISATNSVNFTRTSAPDGLTVYYKLPSDWPGGDTPYIHCWEVGGVGLTTWGENPPMTSQGNDWYSYDIVNESNSTIGLLTKNVAGTNGITYQTPDLTVPEASGTWWYYTNDTWYPSNPEDATTPVLVVDGPTDWRQVTSETVNVFGSASGGGGITGVYISVNGGSYTSATGTASWSKSVSLNLGTNTISVYAEASSGFNSITNILHVVRSQGGGNNHPGTYQGERGAHVYDNGVEFSIWWRSSIVSSVEVNVSGMGSYSMTRITSGDDTDVWWVFVEGALAGDEYTYTGNGTITVADPYSYYNRYSSGDSVVVDHSSFNWTDDTWSRPGWEDYIIYEMHVKDFTSSDTSVSSGNRGKYLGIIEKLDYLTNLGITAIELLPISEFPDAGYSWGYNNSLYFAPESGYAVSPLNGQSGVDELKQLVDACHEYGIAVVLDMVFNHTSSGDNWLWQIDNVSYFDYDLDGTVEAGEGGDDHTPWGNKLATTREPVVNLAKDCLEMFMNEYHIDGFRFDATHSDFMAWDFLNDIKTYASSLDPNVYFVFENLPNEESKTFAAQWSDPYHDDGVDMFKGNDSANYITDEIYYSSSISWWKPGSPFVVVNYVESHDEDTLGYHANLIGYDTGTATARSRMMAVMLATSLGNPMLWMGQEFLRAREGQNIDELALDWSGLATQNSLYEYYGGVFRLRRDNPALKDCANPGSLFQWQCAPWSGGDANVVAYSRQGPTSSDKDFVIVLNFNRYNSKTVNVGFPETGTWTKVVTEGSVNGTETINVTGSSYSITVGANSGIIFMK